MFIHHLMQLHNRRMYHDFMLETHEMFIIFLKLMSLNMCTTK